MAVDTDNLQLFPIQIETAIVRSCLKFHKTHTHPRMVCINQSISILYLCYDRIQIWVIDIP